MKFGTILRNMIYLIMHYMINIILVLVVSHVPLLFDSEDSRAGRWSNFDKTECGLHVADKP